MGKKCDEGESKRGREETRKYRKKERGDDKREKQRWRRRSQYLAGGGRVVEGLYLPAGGQRHRGPPGAPPHWRPSRRQYRNPALNRPRSAALRPCPPWCTERDTCWVFTGLNT